MGNTTFSGPVASDNGFTGDLTGVVNLTNYTVATAPDASAAGAGAAIYVSDGAAGSPVLAFSNGTDFLRCDTLAAIAAV